MLGDTGNACKHICTSCIALARLIRSYPLNKIEEKTPQKKLDENLPKDEVMIQALQILKTPSL